MAAVIPIIAAVAAAGAGALVSGMFSGGQKAPEPQPLPQAPKPDESQEAAAAAEKKRRAAMSSKSVYTSPLGTTGQANVARKTLLGEGGPTG